MKSEKIKETISKLRHKYELIPIVLFALYFLALHLNTPLKMDDLVYINDLQNRTVFQWCKGFYLTWGGGQGTDPSASDSIPADPAYRLDCSELDGYDGVHDLCTQICEASRKREK